MNLAARLALASAIAAGLSAAAPAQDARARSDAPVSLFSNPNTARLPSVPKRRLNPPAALPQPRRRNALEVNPRYREHLLFQRNRDFGLDPGFAERFGGPGDAATRRNQFLREQRRAP